MKQIPLSGGKAYALVDDEDYEFLNQFKWTLTAKGYAMTGVRMHRLIMKAPDGVEVDHIYGNRLDNQKSRMRLCTPEQNSQNKKKWAKTKSGYKGVTSSVRTPGKYQVRICRKRHYHHVGTFVDPHIAALMYDFWALELFGEFAQTNFKVVSQWTKP
jgi:hypothetical protein